MVDLFEQNRKNVKMFGIGFICHRFVSFNFSINEIDYKYYKVA